MTNIDKIEILKFYDMIFRLKKLVRKGWEIRGIKNPESVAEHTLGVALLSMVFAKALNLDIMKCVVIALIHDLGEALIGDLTPADNISSGEKQKIENEATVKILSYVDDSSFFIDLWKEYDLELSDEGKLVKEIDKIEMALQAFSYEKEQGRNLDEFFKYVNKRIKSKDMNSVFSKLLAFRDNREKR